MDDGKRYTEYSLYGFLAIGLAAGLVAGMAIYAAAYPAFQSSAWAAWVQAFGSVGAIIGSYLTGSHLAHKENKLAIERDEKLKKDRQQGYLSLINLAGDIGKNVIAALNEKDHTLIWLRDFLWMGDYRHRAIAVEAALRSVPLNELPSGQQITSLVRVSGALSRLIHQIDAVPSADDISPEEQIKERPTIYNTALVLVGFAENRSIHGGAEKSTESSATSPPPTSPPATQARSSRSPVDIS